MNKRTTALVDSELLLLIREVLELTSPRKFPMPLDSLVTFYYLIMAFTTIFCNVFI